MLGKDLVMLMGLERSVMDQTYLQSSAWYHAMTLTERPTTWRTRHHTMAHVDVDMDLARRRMQRWRSQPPFATGSCFAQRLVADGLTEDALLYLLGEPIECVGDRCTTLPAWIAEVAQAFS